MPSKSPHLNNQKNPETKSQQSKKTSPQEPAEKPLKTPSGRYSDNELQEFRALVTERLQEALTDYRMLRTAISGEESNSTDDTSPTFRMVEDLADVFSKEEMAHLANRRQKYIEQLQNALVRIQNKTYGICRVTGQLINKERLRSVPHTTLSIAAKTGNNAGL